MLVVIDPGHGGNDPGAVRGNLKEANIALALSLSIKHTLINNGIPCILTRVSNYGISIPARADFAKRNKADLFVSIHTNASINPLANGYEIYHTAGDNRSRDLGRVFLHTLDGTYWKENIKIRGAKSDTQTRHKRLGVLRGTFGVMPSFLAEIGFLSNLKDRQKYEDRDFRVALGESVLAVVRRL